METFVVVVDDEHPDEAPARAELDKALIEGRCPQGVRIYLGIWRMPRPHRTPVHVFTTDPPDVGILDEQGWLHSFTKGDLDEIERSKTGQNHQ